MAITYTQLQTELETIKTRIGTGDYAGARTQAALAEVTLSGLFLESGNGDRYQKFRDTLDAVMKAIDAAQVAANGGGGTMLLGARCVRPG